MPRLLCAADLHIGRRPSRLPEAWAHGRVSTARGWLDLVERALADRVDAVLLAGDIIDQDNRYFEAYGPLEDGVRRLAAADIPVVAVAGNHDHASLAEVAAEVGADALVLLGRGGEWERWTLLDSEGRDALRVLGWSFPDRRFGGDPLRGFPGVDGGDVPVVGLLHADLDATESRYAPVARAGLRRTPAAAWVLGHSHTPRLEEAAGEAPLLYPGSLVALDPGEPGWHGAWFLEIAGARPPSFRPVPLSPVRYERVEIRLDGASAEDDVRSRTVAGLRQRLEEVLTEGAGPLELLLARVRLTGRTPLHGGIEEALGQIGTLDLAEKEGVQISVEAGLEVDTRPALALGDLSRGADAPALLARLLLALDAQIAAPGTPDGEPSADGAGEETASAAGPPEVPPDLLRDASRAARAIAERSWYVRLPPLDTRPDAAWLREAIARQAGRILDRLVAAKEGA